MTAFQHGARIYELIGRDDGTDSRPISGLISHLLLADLAPGEAFEIAGYAGGVDWSSTLVVIGTPAAVPLDAGSTINTVEITSHEADRPLHGADVLTEGRLFAGHQRIDLGRIWEHDRDRRLLYLRCSDGEYAALSSVLGQPWGDIWFGDIDSSEMVWVGIELVEITARTALDGFGDVTVTYRDKT